MENSWLVTKPASLVAWQSKIDLRVASEPQSKNCYIGCNYISGCKTSQTIQMPGKIGILFVLAAF